MKNTEWVGFDLDSTICWTEHRWPMVTEGFSDWHAYSLACENDTEGPGFPLARFLSLYEIPWAVVSARDVAAYQITKRWLNNRRLTPWAMMLNDGAGDTEGHGHWKVRMIRELESLFNMPCAFYVEDNDRVGAIIQAAGIPVQMVHDAGARNTILL